MTDTRDTSVVCIRARVCVYVPRVYMYPVRVWAVNIRNLISQIR